MTNYSESHNTSYICIVAELQRDASLCGAHVEVAFHSICKVELSSYFESTKHKA